jgi:hypothetical protein
MLPAGQRAGVLTQASMLAARADLAETSVVRRGAFVARELLCNVTPPPPPGAVDAAAATLKSLPTERARAEYRVGSPTCSPCHSRMDPFGVTFEGYDALGRYRTTIGGQPVDASWQLAYSPEISGPTKDALALAARLAGSTQVSACVVYKMASYAAGSALPAEDACKLTALRRSFAQSGGNLTTLFHDVAAWPGLRVRQDGVKP